MRFDFPFQLYSLIQAVLGLALHSVNSRYVNKSGIQPLSSGYFSQKLMTGKLMDLH